MAQDRYGPFQANSRTEVPLWLAIFLHKRKKCSILPPQWLDKDKLTGVQSLGLSVHHLHLSQAVSRAHPFMQPCCRMRRAQHRSSSLCHFTMLRSRNSFSTTLSRPLATTTWRLVVNVNDEPLHRGWLMMKPESSCPFQRSLASWSRSGKCDTTRSRPVSILVLIPQSSLEPKWLLWVGQAELC